MRPLSELLATTEPAWPLVQSWIADAAVACEVLPPGPTRGEALHEIQITIRSPMGAIAYETGGLLLDHGWLRILGSGHPRLTRSLPAWNRGRSDGFYLVADDAVGGFFAIDGGGFGGKDHHLFYFAPDTLNWEPLEIGYSQFVIWALSDRLSQFYQDLRWSGWETDVRSLPGDRAWSFYPPLWTKEGNISSSHRGDAPVEELWGLAQTFRRQLAGEDAE